MSKTFALFLMLVLAAAGIWGYGFQLYIDDVIALREPNVDPNLEKAEAIVVLTGGSERVTTGLQLLESGIGQKLFISGVHRGISLDGLLSGQPVPQQLKACCIILGYQADSTVGNAEETRDWMKAQGYTSLRLVTANYHMPRSLMLFRAALPDATIIPHPITPDSVKLYEWWTHPGTIQLLSYEYNKFVVATLEHRFGKDK